MTHRPLAWTRRAAFVSMAAAIALAGLVGCDPRQAMFFLQPFGPTVAPPCPSLEKKRVALAIYTMQGMNDFVALDAELARALAPKLRDGIKKLDLVDPEKVATWVRAHPAFDPADLAREFEADVVIYLEVQNFEIQNPKRPEQYEGHSSVQIQVTEMVYPKDSRDRPMKDHPKEPEVIYEGNKDTHFPVTGSMPVEAGVSPSTFKNRFLGLVATELSWQFVEHAPGDDIQNTRFKD